MLPSMNRVWNSVLLFSILLFSCLAAFGQSGTGFPNFSTMTGTPDGPDSINLNNLNFHLQFPIVSKAGRGTPFHFALDYDSVFFILGDTFSPAPRWGWTSPDTMGYLTYRSVNSGWEVLDYVDPAGTHHTFGLQVSPTYLQATGSATDQSGYVLTIKMNVGDPCSTQQCPPPPPPSLVSLIDKVGNHFAVPLALINSDGTQQTAIGPASMTDRNGNVISTDGQGTFTDTLGVKALSISQTTDSNGNLVSKTYTYNVPGGNTASVVVNYKNYRSVATNFQCHSGGSGDYNLSNVSLVDTIVYPDGSKYSFQYEPTPGMPGSVTGRLAALTLPTGGTISYAYPGPNDGIICGDYSIANMTRTTPDGTWTYTRVEDPSGPINGAGFYTTVTDPQGNQTVYRFEWDFNNWPTNYETQRKFYQGSASSGTLLKTAITCYNGNDSNGNDSNCVTQSVSAPITRQDVYSALPTGITQRQDAFLDGTTGVVNEVDDYDWGAPGHLAQKTFNYYTTLGNIPDLLTNVTVTDPTGAQTLRQTNYNYDETSVTSTSGLPQHVAVSGPRGNLTSVLYWLSSVGGTMNGTISTYDDAGNVLSMTDADGNTTNLSYGNNGAYVTEVTLPDTSSPNLTHHQTSATYDTNSGVLLSTTGENGQTTTFSYDKMFHPTKTDFADGGQTKVFYDSATQVHTQNKIDGSRTSDSYVQLDSLGRTSRTAVSNGESTPYDQQDVCYNSIGQIGFQSYAYQGNGLSNTSKVCSGAGNSFAYDALGRTTSITHSDGTSMQYTYTGRATQVTDEGNNSTRVTRITQSDGLGRLTSVCEVSNTALTGNGGTPTACGQDISATGFLTTYGYSYDNSGNLTTTISQGNLSPRIFVSDSLGRLTSETEPEWIATGGTTPSATTYSYDHNGLLTQRIRPAMNQTNPAVTTTTNYVYDPLGRLVQRSYTNDSNTPPATFNYDEASAWGTSLQNPSGRLTSEYNANARNIFSYDSMGRIVNNWQCTPSTCGSSSYPLYAFNYQYDLAGDVISATNGLGTQFNYSYNLDGLAELDSSVNDANHPAKLLSNVHYGPFGPVSDLLGNGVAENVSYSPRGQVSNRTAQLLGNPASGSVAIAGAERSRQVSPGTPGQGSVTINGALQSTTVQTQAAAPGSALIYISGEPEQYTWDPCASAGDGSTCPETDWDDGWENLIVNGSYGGSTAPIPSYYCCGQSAAFVMSNFATGINSSTSLVHATVTSYQGMPALTITSTTAGSSTNYPMAAWSQPSAQSQTNSFVLESPSPTFDFSTGNFSLTGGQDAAYATVYDSGTCTITVNSHGDSQSFSGSGTTAAGIAAALANNINNDGSAFVNAAASGNTISLVARNPGATTNYSLSSSCSYDSGHFSTPSFTTANSGLTLTGGTGPGTSTVYDTGTVTVTVNGFSKTVLYGQTDTSTTLASTLAAAFSDPNSPVSASSSGGTLNLQTPTGAAGINYSLSASSATNNANFTGSSFTATPSGATLTGGTGGLLYSYALSSAPDGNIITANDSVNGSWAYSYDPLNRLSAANKNAGQQTFSYGYDRFNNRLQVSAPQGGPAPQYVFDNYNHISGSGVIYDALGNITNDGLGNSFTYDAEGRLVQAVNGGGTFRYAYDPDGQRVSGPNAEYIYDLAGRAVTSINPATGVWSTEIYAGGRHLAGYSGGASSLGVPTSYGTTSFLHTDWLGTKRATSAVNGSLAETCTSLPFGDGLNCTGTDSSFFHFTDYLHDAETNLEHTLFRKYSTTQGRWTTPDPYQGSMDFTDPQSLNRYAYVSNNPVNATDPTGLADLYCDGVSDNTDGMGHPINCLENGGYWNIDGVMDPTADEVAAAEADTPPEDGPGVFEEDPGVFKVSVAPIPDPKSPPPPPPSLDYSWVIPDNTNPYEFFGNRNSQNGTTDVSGQTFGGGNQRFLPFGVRTSYGPRATCTFNLNQWEKKESARIVSDNFPKDLPQHLPKNYQEVRDSSKEVFHTVLHPKKWADYASELSLGLVESVLNDAVDLTGLEIDYNWMSDYCNSLPQN